MKRGFLLFVSLAVIAVLIAYCPKFYSEGYGH